MYLRENVPVVAKYACLSHCWGTEGPLLRLESTNMNDFLRGIDLLQLPQTFRDTVNLCLRLQMRYLWIDALCRRHLIRSLVRV